MAFEEKHLHEALNLVQLAGAILLAMLQRRLRSKREDWRKRGVGHFAAFICTFRHTGVYR
jgi:hypothetical protein